MAGVHHQARFATEMGAVFNSRQLLHPFRRRGGIGISAGVQFDHRRAGIFGRLDLRFVRIDKERHAYASLAERVGERGNFFLLRQHVQPAFGGDFFALFGHDAHIGGHHFERVFKHFFGERHFQIHARADGLLDGKHIGIFDVAAVFAQVQGNQIGAVGFGNQRRFERAGIRRAACIAQGGHMIDINT